MEQEPGHKELPPMSWSCEHCGTEYEIDDNTTNLYVDMKHDGKYTFVQFDCKAEDCAEVTKYFTDLDSTNEIGVRVTNIYPMYDIPKWVKQGWKELQHSKEVEQPTIELSSVDADCLVWDAMIAYLEPDDFKKDHL